MKFRFFLFFLAIFFSASLVNAQDIYLTAPRYKLHKGDKLEVYLMTGEQFKNIDELKYDSSKTSRFTLIDGGKKINLMPAAKDSASPVVSQPLNNAGMALVEMVRKTPPTAIDRDVYGRYLADEGLVKLSETVNNSNQNTFREKKVSYLKTMVMVDKPNSGDFDKQLGQEYEITLKKNPYKLNYGDDITGTLYLKGKPLKAATIDIFVKVQSGNVYADKTTTNEKGEFPIITSREGVYMIRAATTVVSTTPDADFETVQTAFTFLFTNNNQDTLDWEKSLRKQ